MRFGIKPPLASGLLIASIGLLLLARTPVDGNYWIDVFPSMCLLGYALGVALIVVPLLMARRIVAGRSGRERWRRVGTITEVVALGVALCVVAHLLGQHGWLLIALPAAAVLLARVARAAKPVGAAPPR